MWFGLKPTSTNGDEKKKKKRHKTKKKLKNQIIKKLKFKKNLKTE